MKKVLFGTVRRKVTVIALIGALVASTAAYAAWALSGNGTAKGTLGSLQALTIVDATSSPTNKAIPGGQGDLAIKVTNPNSGALTLTGITPNGTATNPAGTAGCASASQATITTNTLTGLSIAIPAGTTDNIVIPNAYSLGATSPTASQGTSWDFPITATAQAGAQS